MEELFSVWFHKEPFYFTKEKCKGGGNSCLDYRRFHRTQASGPKLPSGLFGDLAIVTTNKTIYILFIFYSYFIV